MLRGWSREPGSQADHRELKILHVASPQGWCGHGRGPDSPGKV